MEESPRRRRSSWPDIPADLAGLVLGRLAARVDRARFAAVCPQWRSAAAHHRPLPPPLPLLVLPDATAYSLPSSEPLRLRGCCAGYTGACDNWLAFSDDDDSRSSCFLKDPLSNATVPLPPLSRARVRRVADDADADADESSLPPWTRLEEGEELRDCKVMLCSPRLVAATVSFRRSTAASESTGVAVCRPEATTSRWSVHLSATPSPHFVHMASHQGTLYAITSSDELFAVGIGADESTGGDPFVSRVQRVISAGLLASPFTMLHGVVVIKETYLVASRGALLVVCQRMEFPSRPPGQRQVPDRDRFEVFEADFRRSRWSKVTTLGDDRVIFVCRRSARSFSFCYDEAPGDHIFFVDIELEVRGGKEGNSISCSAFDMRDGKVSTLLPTLSSKPGNAFATWLFPQD